MWWCISVPRRCAVALGVVALAGRPALAGKQPALAPEPYYLTVQLDVPAAEAPDHVCIITTGAHPEWAIMQVNGQLGPPNASLPLSELVSLTAGARLAAASQAATPAFDGTWRFDLDSQARILAPEGPLHSRPYIAKALAALVMSAADSASCSANGSICTPTFESALTVKSQGDLHMFCAPNARPTSHQLQQVLVAFLNSHTGVPPPTRSVILDGNVLTIQFDGNVQDHDVFVIAALGGHYAADTTAASINRRIVLPLFPRCRITEVELPYYDQRSEQQFTVTLHETHEKNSCTLDVVDSLARIRLPFRADSETKTLELRGASSGLRFVGKWSERPPPATLRTTLQGLSFVWNRHCLYPKRESCPEAHLLDSGYKCTANTSEDGSCSYVCDSESATVPIRTPEVVQFERKRTHQTWTGRVTFSGIHLSDYVPLEQRKLVVEIPESKETGSWLASLHALVGGIDVDLPRGGTLNLRYMPGTDRVIDVPGAECEQTATTRYLGAFPYRPDPHRLSGGVLHLDEPEADHLAFDGQMEIGTGYELKPAYASGEREFLSFPAGGTFMFGAHAAISRWGSPWFYEAAFENTYGVREYLIQDSASSTTIKRAWIARALLSVGAGIRVSRSTLSVDVGGGLSGALAPDQTDHLPISAFFAPSLRSTIPLTNSSSLSLITTYYFGETTRVFDTNDMYLSSQPRHRASIVLAWSLSLGNLLSGLFAHTIRDVMN